MSLQEQQSQLLLETVADGKLKHMAGAADTRETNRSSSRRAFRHSAIMAAAGR